MFFIYIYTTMYFRFVMNTVKEEEFYRRYVEYIVRDGKTLIIISELLARRVEEKQRWSGGIHQAMEASEGLKIDVSIGFHFICSGCSFGHNYLIYASV
ncbi:Protein translocase subunit SA2, chloroplastic [Stylosanthes scabra]|uniref:Protein translocase subunit SA2, chloroplastic n=1 Tax=Stylosanthes scabra TaxID=79078 RepID=A0ABU6X6G0_9FABA|nr:Protein translocase subunit SA2, chloroplastic [Stylosanthes scabra]